MNLYLGVRGRRPDGYHELETLFVTLAWGDTVLLSRTDAPGVRLHLFGDVDGVPDDASNLAVRAAESYLDAAAQAGARVDGGLDIRLVKTVPPGAGLGGGSSDAAAVLASCDREWGALPREDLLGLAASLGADVPYFLLGAQAAVGRGRGDVLEEVPVPASFPPDVVLYLPRLRNGTARVFAHVPAPVDPPPPEGLARALEALASGDAAEMRAAHHNALLEPARCAYPEFATLYEEVERRLGRRPCLTGTGAALYDWPDPGEALEVLERLAGLPGRVVHLPSLG